MKNPSFPSSSESSRPPGFTLVELLVVITIVAALAAVVGLVARNARTSATKVADMNNLRNLATAATAAGVDNIGRFPQIHSGAKEGNSHYAPYWLTNSEYLESNGIHRQTCYAPGRDIFGGAPNYDWWLNYQPQGTPAHYAYFANDANQPADAWFLKGKVTAPSRSEYRGGIPYDEITRDSTKAFARTVTSDAWYPVLWAGICRDFAGSPRVAAVMRGGEALGVNVMYIDGHGEWVPRNKMKARYTSGSLTLFW